MALFPSILYWSDKLITCNKNCPDVSRIIFAAIRIRANNIEKCHGVVAVMRFNLTATYQRMCRCFKYINIVECNFLHKIASQVSRSRKQKLHKILLSFNV